MTYDDGINPATMEPLLDILDQIKATFFINGLNFGNIYQEQATVRRMKNSGHCVASHGMFHHNNRDLSAEEQFANLKELDHAIKEIIGVRPRFYRPPYGGIGAETINVCARLDYDVVLWNLDRRDCE
jgi:peptidoglycan/xylan/chitin deacetylase (PgdA/CDA1 family)